MALFAHRPRHRRSSLRFWWWPISAVVLAFIFSKYSLAFRCVSVPRLRLLSESVANRASRSLRGKRAELCATAAPTEPCEPVDTTTPQPSVSAPSRSYQFAVYLAGAPVLAWFAVLLAASSCRFHRADASALPSGADGTSAVGVTSKPNEGTLPNLTVAIHSPTDDVNTFAEGPRLMGVRDVPLRAPALALSGLLDVSDSLEEEEETASTPSGRSAELVVTRPRTTDAVGQVVFLYASPLCHIAQAQRPVPMPQIPFVKECAELERVADEARCGAVLLAGPLTAASLQRAIAPTCQSDSAMVLHLSAHGVNGHLVLEDGRCTAQFLSGDMVREMVALRRDMTDKLREGLRLVTLNACSLCALGEQFLRGGVPHLICSSGSLRDSASRVFFSVFYAALFQGNTVGQAFRGALVALRCDPDEFTRASAVSMHLLPEGGDHEEALFQHAFARVRAPAASVRLRKRRRTVAMGTQRMVSTSTRRRHTRIIRGGSVAATFPLSSLVAAERALPSLPEDFLGRAVDVWATFQHLRNRRVVVVSGQPGVGKSGVLDSVRRACVLQLGGVCVAVRLGHGDGGDAQGAMEEVLELAASDVVGQVLFIIDQCDVVIRRPEFQDAIARILDNNFDCRILLSAREPVEMTSVAGGRFKVVQQRLVGLAPMDAARLFLARVRRPLRWEELSDAEDKCGAIGALTAAAKKRSPDKVVASAEPEVLARVAEHPLVVAQNGNPRLLIWLADQVGPSLEHLADLAPAS